MKTGLITFHSSYNCGSMLQTFALQTVLEKLGHQTTVLDFSNDGQRALYSVFSKSCDLKSIVKNCIMLLCKNRVEKNFASYEDFKNKYFHLSSRKYLKACELTDDGFETIVTGSDQVWNITIEDGDDAYFLPWVTKARKIAYSPSFGARNILEHSQYPEKYAGYLKSFHSLSIRENNGKKWIKDLTGLDVPVLIDPTLILSREDYDQIASTRLKLPKKYIFYYSPGYSRDINKLVSNISEKYNLPVIAFNTKTFYNKGMFLSKMTLPDLENPSTYLQLIKNATMVITTSFHGSIFSSVYNKCFWVVKNGNMFITDDRVPTLVRSLDLEDRVVNINFDNEFDYLQQKDYSKYYELLAEERTKALNYIKQSFA